MRYNTKNKRLSILLGMETKLRIVDTRVSIYIDYSINIQYTNMSSILIFNTTTTYLSCNRNLFLLIISESYNRSILKMSTTDCLLKISCNCFNTLFTLILWNKIYLIQNENCFVCSNLTYHHTLSCLCLNTLETINHNNKHINNLSTS